MSPDQGIHRGKCRQIGNTQEGTPPNQGYTGVDVARTRIRSCKPFATSRKCRSERCAFIRLTGRARIPDLTTFLRPSSKILRTRAAKSPLSRTRTANSPRPHETAPLRQQKERVDETFEAFRIDTPYGQQKGAPEKPEAPQLTAPQGLKPRRLRLRSPGSKALAPRALAL